MKQIAVAILASLALLTGCKESTPGTPATAVLPWLTDLPQAQARAKSENKPVLIDFTGSDWCGWCIKFDKEVFATKEFEDYAAKNLVLVKLDFPQRTAQSEALKKANEAARDQFKVEGFPTFVVLSADGKEIGRQEGYSAGGPQAFIAKLEVFKAAH